MNTCQTSQPLYMVRLLDPRAILQMKTRLLAFLLLLPICAEAGNAKIAAFVQTFDGRSLYSGSSFWPAIELPKDASPSQVCDALLKSGSVQFTSYRITTTETVRMVLDHVPVGTDGKPKWTPVKEPITATLIQTDVGETVVFMQYIQTGWRTVVYDISQRNIHDPIQGVGLAKPSMMKAGTNTVFAPETNKSSNEIEEPSAAGYRREAAPQPEH